MEIVDATKFAIGIAFALAGIAVFVVTRGSRGFDQRKQAGAMFILAAAIFVAIGLGWLAL